MALALDATAIVDRLETRRSLARGHAIDQPQVEKEYWAALREVARQSDPDLALAQHLAQERRRLFPWYPYGDAWRHSPDYARACQQFEQQVMHVLADEIGSNVKDKEEGHGSN